MEQWPTQEKRCKLEEDVPSSIVSPLTLKRHSEIASTPSQGLTVFCGCGCSGCGCGWSPGRALLMEEMRVVICCSVDWKLFCKLSNCGRMPSSTAASRPVHVSIFTVIYSILSSILILPQDVCCGTSNKEKRILGLSLIGRPYISEILKDQLLVVLCTEVFLTSEGPLSKGSAINNQSQGLTFTVTSHARIWFRLSKGLIPGRNC